MEHSRAKLPCWVYFHFTCVESDSIILSTGSLPTEFMGWISENHRSCVLPHLYKTSSFPINSLQSVALALIENVTANNAMMNGFFI